MAPKWYVIRMEPRADFQAARALHSDGIELYFPRIRGSIRGKMQSEIPLFPGYLFIKWDRESDEWPIFRPAHRITGWVSIGDEVPSISDEAITQLKTRVDAINGSDGLWRRFKVGEKVEIDSGGFQGLAEVIEEAKTPTGKALVLLQFMGRMVKTQVPWVDLQPSSDHPIKTALDIEKVRVPRRTRGRGRWVRDYEPSITANAEALAEINAVLKKRGAIL